MLPESYCKNYEINCEWGLKDIEALAPVSDVIIIVDVLSFSTSVDIACANGAYIYPKIPGSNTDLPTDSILAGPRNLNNFSLSPYSLLEIPPETKLILSSPNGSTLSLSTRDTLTLCACLRNFRSVAAYAMDHGKRISVIPAGERWDDGSVRFALEDLFGAGAILSCLKGAHSPESIMAVNLYHSLHNEETETILKSVSGIELVENGFEVDVYLAADMNVSECVPVLNNGFYSDII